MSNRLKSFPLGHTIGVVEGFFGPAWPMDERKAYASFLEMNGGGFYIYAPKEDPYLRKKWREAWSDEFILKLKDMATHFNSHGVQFGVGLSPFGLGADLSQADRQLLQEKLSILVKSGVQILGLFFDDMPSDENLASTQIACLKVVKQSFPRKIVFCPSYYTFDPILEKVFGRRPDGYWEAISQGIAGDVAMAWTGPKVISPVISNDHLVEAAELLKRRPFIWENVFANDGPKNCKFLKLKPFSGREVQFMEHVEAIGFNMMNQPLLSQLVFRSSVLVLFDELDPDEAFDQALEELCSEGFKKFIQGHRQVFLEQGLDKITESDKAAYLSELSKIKDGAAREMEKWLRGGYTVGSECLTD